MNRVHDETSEALLAAAHRLLADDGPEALTVRRIATEAGMSTMNVYSRFGGKDGVVDELYADGFRRLFGAINAVPTTDDVPQDLIQAACAYREFALTNPTYYGVMFRATVPGFEPSQESIEAAFDGFQHFVERVRLGQERRDIVGDTETDPLEVAAWLWAACHGLVSFEVGGTGSERVDWSRVFNRGMAAAVAGLHPSVVAQNA